MSHFLQPSGDFHPLRIKANIFTMVHKALYVQALIISLISSPTSLLLIHSTPVTLPHWSSKTVAIFLPWSLWTYYFCKKYSSPNVSQPHSLISFMSVLKVSASVRPFLLVWDKCPLSYQHSYFYAFFFPLHFSPSGIYILQIVYNYQEC